jgi:chromosomal replication initiation ATPase DnaA
MIAEHIVSSVCNTFQITKKELRSKKRDKHLVDARQTCAFALRKMDCTYQFIGDAVNRESHTTIIHILKKRHDNSHQNSRIASKIVKEYKDMALPKITPQKLNMEEFLEMVQQIRS